MEALYGYKCKHIGKGTIAAFRPPGLSHWPSVRLTKRHIDSTNGTSRSNQSEHELLVQKRNDETSFDNYSREPTFLDVIESLSYLPMDEADKRRMRDNLEKGIEDKRDIEAYGKAVELLEQTALAEDEDEDYDDDCNEVDNIIYKKTN